MIMEKNCKRCNLIKDILEFGKNKNNKDGTSIYCKECERNRSKKFNEENQERRKLISKKWRDNNKEKQKEFIKRYLEKNPHMISSVRLKKYRQDPEFLKKDKERRKLYYQNNIEKERERRKQYYHKNKETERKKNNDWKKNNLKTDPLERMKKNIRDRIREYLTGENKSKRTFDIIGLDKEKFKSYIENKFTEGMTWENYGKWHLDHIKPLYLSENEEDLIKLNHYTNLQPLWSEDNLKKNRKYDN
jgi:hypothetical protein